MNETFEKIYAASNTNTEESKQTELFEQIYKEAEMLNEMNPKLRAMLLGGALAAGLGMQSCSMPTDIPYDSPVIEQPAPTDETPGEETPGETDPGETDPDNPDNPENGGNEKMTLEDMFDENKDDHVTRLSNVNDNDCLRISMTYSAINTDIACDYFVYVYNIETKKFSQLSEANIPTGSFDGYLVTKGSYAYCIPDDTDTVTLFNKLLPINLQ